MLVEEPSMRAAVEVLLPRLVDKDCIWAVHDLGSKQQLLKKLPVRLKAYESQARTRDVRVLVLVDRDDDDCLHLKKRLEDIASEMGLRTRSTSGGELFEVCNRIVVEELEAWFLADAAAVRAAYPKVPDFARRKSYRDPDAVKGGTWEALERLLQRCGYHPGGLAKVRAAQDITPHLDIENTRSASFAAFVNGVRALVHQEAA